MENSASPARFARRLRIGTIAIAVALVAVTAIGAVMPPQQGVRVDSGGLPHGWGVAVAAVTVVLIVLALAALARMLRRIEQGEVFASATTRHFRRFAALLLAAALTGVLLPPAIGIALALAAQGHGSAMLSIDDTDVIVLLLGGVLFLVARLFDEAARLDEDSRSIV